MVSIRKLLSALCLLAALCVCAPVSAFPAQGSSEEIQNALRAAARSLDLQTELPEAAPMRPENFQFPDVPDFSLPEHTATVLLCIAVAIALVVTIQTLRRTLWSNSRSRRLSREELEEIAPAATAARMDKAQLVADDLAGRGNFAEAMHMLLLQSVGELRRRLNASIAISLTSREILARVALSPEGRAGFADIIQRVEISYFGAHQPNEAEYLACRDSFETLTATLRAQEGRAP